MHPTITALHFGYTPIKGTRHQPQTITHITPQGIRYNRRWAIINPTTGAVLRTVHYPQLHAVTTVLHTSGTSTHLTINIPGYPSHTLTPPTGPTQAHDYWGRTKNLTTYQHPINQALSAYLNTPAALAYAPDDHLIYRDPLTLIGTATLHDLQNRLGPQAPNLLQEHTRFRANLLIHTQEPYIEETWQGQTLTLNPAPGLPQDLKGLTLTIGAGVGRCAVIDSHPDTGQRGTKILKTLASYRPRNHRGEPILAVYATPQPQPAPAPQNQVG